MPRKTVQKLQQAPDRYLELIADMDRLLATRREFLLGAWLSDAKRWGTTDEERRLHGVECARDHYIVGWTGQSVARIRSAAMGRFDSRLLS